MRQGLAQATNTAPDAPGAAVESWDIEIQPGGQAAGAGRQRDQSGARTVFLGDTVIIRAHIKKLGKYPVDEVATPSDITYGGTLEVVQRQWETPTTFKWVLKPKKVGRGQVKTAMTDEPSREKGEAPEAIGEYEGTIHIVDDFDDFLAACVQAQSTLGGKFNHATRRINEAATAFREAYSEQEKVLSAASAEEKMMEQVLWGALFAAAGGFVGSLVSTQLKGWKDLDAAGSSVGVMPEPLVEAAKDTVKFEVRSLDNLRQVAGKSSSGGASAPSLTNPIRAGGGSYQPMGENPQAFLTKLSANIAGEGEAADKALTDLMAGARTARSANPNIFFDEDPVEVVTRDRTLDAIAQDLVTDKKQYLVALWKAYCMEYGPWGGVGSGAIYDAIDEVARSVGESVEQWYDEFMAAQAAKHPAPDYPPPHGTQRPL